jgi:hypothetical protein
MTSKITRATATVEGLVEAIRQLGRSGETSSYKITCEVDPSNAQRFDAEAEAERLNDFASDGELIEASPLPLSEEHHLALIKSSFPSSGKKRFSKAVNPDALLYILRVLNLEDDHQPSAGAADTKEQRVFANIATGHPATLDEVLAAIIRLSDIDEVTVLERVSAGQMNYLFPFELRSVTAKHPP